MSRVDLTAERLSLALAAARLGDFYWDLGADLVTFSPRAAEICGLVASTPLSRQQVHELVHPDDRNAVSAAVDSAVRTVGQYSLDHRILIAGRERWVTASGRALAHAHGNVVGIVGVLQDITGHRFLMTVDDAVRALVDPEQITYEAARLLGQQLNVDRCAYAFVEDDEDTFILTGNYTRGVPSIIGRYRFRQFGAECLRLMRAGLPYVVEDSKSDARVDDADREAYQVTAICGVICVPVIKSGRFVGAMAVHTQLPRRWHHSEVELVQQVASRSWESIERPRVEAERQRLLEAAQMANRAKDEFLAMLGHELRNPLAPIRTAVQLMKLRQLNVFERERTVIERQVNYLVRLVDDLLDVARIARGMVELELVPVELLEVVTRAVEIAQPLLAQRAHTLNVQVPSRGLGVEADVQRLTQVVTNLLTNAAKYTPPGGTIDVLGHQEGEEVVLQVRDTGVGMSQAVLERAFDLFVQGRQGADRAQGGLGLGLSIVKNLVQRHGGSVVATSAGPGGGSELTFRLPRIDLTRTGGTSQKAEPPSSPSPTAMKLRVLVVDDNVDAAQLLAAALSSSGHDVSVAHDAVEALRLAAEQTFDAALLDIGLPVMDGYELAARLGQLPHLRKTALVAVTGYGQASDKDRAMRAGFRDHLVKPVDVASVQRVLQELHAT